MPTSRISPRDKKLASLASMQEADQRQQAVDAQGAAQTASQGQAAQTGLLQMLTGLYGLQNEQTLDPLKQQLLQSQVQGQTLENQFKPDLYQAQINSENNRGDLYGRDKQNDPKLAQYLDFVKTMAAGGHVLPDAEKYRSVADYTAGQNAAAAQKNSNTWNEVQTQFQHGTPPPDADVVNKFGTDNLEYLKTLTPPSDPLATVPKSFPGAQEAVLNAGGKAADAYKWLTDMFHSQPTPPPAPPSNGLIQQMYLPRRGATQVY